MGTVRCIEPQERTTPPREAIMQGPHQRFCELDNEFSRPTVCHDIDLLMMTRSVARQSIGSCAAVARVFDFASYTGASYKRRRSSSWSTSGGCRSWYRHKRASRKHWVPGNA